MKIYKLITLLAVGFLFSCEQLEEITERDYPFVESIGISDLDESGATVNFEVLKNGKGTITEYGVEFIEFSKVRFGQQDVEYMAIRQIGAPSSPFISIRISYDLINLESYIVRPYAKTDDLKVYGANLVFDSRGVKAPVVTAVSPTSIFLGTRMTINGDFFNSRLEENKVEILGLEDDFKIVVTQATRQELEVWVEMRSNNFSPSQEKYDLRVTSGGKSVLVQDLISLAYPSITEVSPLSLFVGDSIRIRIDIPQAQGTIGFYLNYGQIPSVDIPLVEGPEPGEYRGYVLGMPSGRYPLSFQGTRFSDEFEQSIEILSSWESFQQNLQVPNLRDYQKSIVGDHLLIWNQDFGDLVQFFSFDLGATGLRELSTKSSPNLPRAPAMSGVAEGRYFYYGLGSSVVNGIETPQKDFYRYDMVMDTWEQLADFPFEFSGGIKGFGYQGKFYGIMNRYLNFSEYDPQTNQWSLSPYRVPDKLRTAESQVLIGDYLYYLSSKSPLTVERYKLGGSPEVFYQSNVNIQWNDRLDLSSWDGHLLILGRGDWKFRINLTDKSFRSIQNIPQSAIGIPIPWVTSQGLLMAFPLNPNAYEQENVIYRLIQDFD